MASEASFSGGAGARAGWVGVLLTAGTETVFSLGEQGQPAGIGLTTHVTGQPSARRPSGHSPPRLHFYPCDIPDLRGQCAKTQGHLGERVTVFSTGENGIRSSVPGGARADCFAAAPRSRCSSSHASPRSAPLPRTCPTRTQHVREAGASTRAPCLCPGLRRYGRLQARPLGGLLAECV